MKTIIWDFNGTILDDVQYCIDIENQMSRDWNLKVPVIQKEVYLENFCFPVKNYYLKMGYDFVGYSYEELSHEFQLRFDQNFLQLGLCKGVKEALSHFKSLGYKQVILSASQQEDLLKQVHLLGIEDYFEEIMGIQNNLAHSKVQRALDWMAQTKVNPEDCLYIGDTDHDAEVAMHMGIQEIVLIAQGHQSYEKLKKDFDKVYPSLLEIEF